LSASGKVDIDDRVAPKVDVNPSAPAAKTTAAASKRGGAARKAVQPSPIPAEEAKNSEADLFQTGMSLRDLELVEDAVGLLADLLTDANRLKQWSSITWSRARTVAFASIFPPGSLVVCLDPKLRLYKSCSMSTAGFETRAVLQAAQVPAPPSPGAKDGPRAWTPALRRRAPMETAVPGASGASITPALPETIVRQIRTALEFVANLELGFDSRGNEYDRAGQGTDLSSVRYRRSREGGEPVTRSRAGGAALMASQGPSFAAVARHLRRRERGGIDRTFAAGAQRRSEPGSRVLLVSEAIARWPDTSTCAALSPRPRPGSALV